MAKVMIVDDAAFMRMLLRGMLEEARHIVVGEAVNGLEAVEQYSACRPDLVLMDMTMPEMEGVDAVREIIKIDARAKIIMCSAMGQKKLIIDAMEAGAKDFVVKPVQAMRVLDAVDKVLQA
ncbi:response regulator [Paenibacillus sp. y28]|uniref:response regulator n=1 Tax=Paenibacillus sp. y28 TaxID=3129110 RepID=UPI0030188221